MLNCGLSVSQRVYCWGHISSDSSRPVSGLYSQISVSGFFGCGILIDGRINCWGSAKIVDLIKNDDSGCRFVQISCSHGHCCALDETGYKTHMRL